MSDEQTLSKQRIQDSFIKFSSQVVSYPFKPSEQKRVEQSLKNNEILSFPTETVYGLGGNALSLYVNKNIYKLKERDRKKPLLILADKKWISWLCHWENKEVEILMKTFWPGPLTLILNCNEETPDFLRDKKGRLAVRYSSSPVVQKLIELGNCPIIGTSANLTGQPECHSVDEVTEQLGSKVDLYIDGGKFAGLETSTIVDCSTTPFQMIRQGAIPLAKLIKICGVL